MKVDSFIYFENYTPVAAIANPLAHKVAWEVYSLRAVSACAKSGYTGCPCYSGDPLMQKISTPDLSDNFDDVRALELSFVNYGAVRCFSGKVVTIKCYEDNSLVKQTVAEPGEGRVIVVDGGGSRRRALLGDMLAEQAANNGWSGLVIYGVIRDVDEIAQTEIGVQALGHCPLKTQKLGVGQKDVVLRFGGAEISPGDYVYADNNGVLVSTRELL
jgi:regulator of ribonuclease activity A